MSGPAKPTGLAGPAAAPAAAGALYPAPTPPPEETTMPEPAQQQHDAAVATVAALRAYRDRIRAHLDGMGEPRHDGTWDDDELAEHGIYSQVVAEIQRVLDQPGRG